MLNSTIESLIKLTDMIYHVDITHNISQKKDIIMFISDDNFDWFEYGIFIYYPEFESEPGVDYVTKGSSTIYELSNPVNPSKFIDAKIYIREDYHNILHKYIGKYQISDQEDKDQTHTTSYNYTHFFVNTRA